MLLSRQAAVCAGPAPMTALHWDDFAFVFFFYMQLGVQGSDAERAGERGSTTTLQIASESSSVSGSRKTDGGGR